MVVPREREQLGLESTGDLSYLTEGDFIPIPPIRVKRVLPLLLKMGERSASMSEAACSRFITSCPVRAEVEKAVWSEDSYTGTFDNGHPQDWESVRDGLHRKGKSLGGPKGSVGNLVFVLRASLALNLMQHRYKSHLIVVGGQGRLFVERALGVFIPAADLADAAAAAAASKK